MSNFDVIVIGSGPGGYVCAIRCAQLGMKTAIVERYPTLGGTCLNVGCIPSKAMLDSSERYHETVSTYDLHGIKVSKVEIDFKQMVQRVQDVVSQTCEGVKFLMNKNKIEVFHGHGTFKDDKTLTVNDGKNSTEITAKNFVIATGSKPSSLPGIEIDKERIITSTEALKMKEIPKHLIVIGGGVIGLELTSVYKRLESKVSVVEYADSIIGMMDKDMGKNLQKVLKKDGVDFFTSHQVTEVKNTGKEVVVKAKDLKKDKEIELKGDYCLVAVGRRPFTDNLGLEAAGVEMDERGRVHTNDHLQTNKPHIYAIGDVVKGMMLAHKAEEEGTMAA